MKLVLTKEELETTLRAVYPPMAGYMVEGVEINEYTSGSYCVIKLEQLPLMEQMSAEADAACAAAIRALPKP